MLVFTLIIKNLKNRWKVWHEHRGKVWYCPYLSNSLASSHVAEKACSNAFTQQDRQWLLRPLSPATEHQSFVQIIERERENTGRNLWAFLPEQASLIGTQQNLRDIRALLSPPAEGLELRCDRGIKSPPLSWELNASVTLSLSFRTISLKWNLRIARLEIFQWAEFLEHFGTTAGFLWWEIWGFTTLLTNPTSPLDLRKGFCWVNYEWLIQILLKKISVSADGSKGWLVQITSYKRKQNVD